MFPSKTWKVLKRSLATLLVIIMFTSIATAVYGHNYEVEQQKNAQIRSFLREHTSEYISKHLNSKNVKGIRETARRKNNGESSSWEGLNEVVLQMEDGSETAYVFAEDIKFIDQNGEVQYKDNSIVSQTDPTMLNEGYDYSNYSNDYRLHFSSNPSKGVYINDNQNVISLAPITSSDNVFGMKNTTEIDEETVDVFEYPSAFGTDTLLRYTPQLNAVRKDIILQSYQGKNSFDFMLYTYGNAARVGDDKTLQIYNPITEDIVSSFQPVFAYDSFEGVYSEDESHYTENCYYELTQVSDFSYKLTIVVDEAFLQNANYPVTIDPVTSNLSTSFDVPVYSLYPTTYCGANPTNCFGKASEYGNGRVYAKFALPSEIGSHVTINSATYRVRDNALNVTNYASAITIKIDKNAPEISSVDGNTASLTINKMLTVSAAETGSNGSGIKDYSFDGGTSWQTANSKVFSANQTIAANKIRVRDNAGNVTTFADAIVIDKIIRPNPPVVYENGDYVGASFGAASGGSALKEIQYKIGDGAWQIFTDTALPIQREMKFSITLRVVDIAGNVSAEVPVNLGAYTETAQDMAL
jgi:hypothetical protein